MEHTLVLICLKITATFSSSYLLWAWTFSVSVCQSSLKPKTCSHRALIMLDLQTSIWTFPKWGIWFQSLDWLFVAVGDFDGKKQNKKQKSAIRYTKWHFVALALSVHTAPTNQSNSFPFLISHCFLNSLNWDHLERKPRVPVTSN